MEKKPAAINVIWLFLILSGILTAAYTNKMDVITKASFDSAKNAVTLAFNLIGAMALWLGIMKVAEHAGLMKIIAKAIRPVMVWLFPDVPAEHPAMSAMIMNMAANMLGLGNAATPMGIKAMTELEKINPNKGTATNSMCLFLAVNTSSVTILPLGVIAVRAAAGATTPSAILIPAILATVISTTVAIIVSKLLAGRSSCSEDVYNSSAENLTKNLEQEIVQPEVELVKVSVIMKIIGYTALALFLYAIAARWYKHGMPPFSLDTVTKMTDWLIPIIMGGLLLFGFLRGVKVYESVTEGAKEGFNVAVRIIPYMVAIFVAIGIFRESGALTILTKLTSPLLSLIGMPVEVLPMALLRPLSGTGAFGLMSEIVSKAPDSFSSFLASVIQGSTETTFYVLAVYFGAAGIKKTRHALPAALCADAAGILGSLLVCHFFFK
ncbi:MAG: spore maturation protein [Chitinispirillaceae bacterium]|nr:spore maturation protein [Chitinispirillaceae bacterium]